MMRQPASKRISPAQFITNLECCVSLMLTPYPGDRRFHSRAGSRDASEAGLTYAEDFNQCLGSGVRPEFPSGVP